jgi:hypothetical protein
MEGWRDSETQDTDKLLERPKRPSIDEGAEGTQPTEVKEAQPYGA